MVNGITSLPLSNVILGAINGALRPLYNPATGLKGSAATRVLYRLISGLTRHVLSLARLHGNRGNLCRHKNFAQLASQVKSMAWLVRNSDADVPLSVGSGSQAIPTLPLRFRPRPDIIPARGESLGGRAESGHRI
jgi:hypothetical protein